MLIKKDWAFGSFWWENCKFTSNSDNYDRDFATDSFGNQHCMFVVFIFIFTYCLLLMMRTRKDMNKKAISSYRESRFRKFNSKYIENIKIARSISRARSANFPHWSGNPFFEASISKYKFASLNYSPSFGL